MIMIMVIMIIYKKFSTKVSQVLSIWPNNLLKTIYQKRFIKNDLLKTIY